MAKWDKLGTVFLRARELSGEERQRYLEEACAGEPALLAELGSLLEHHSEEFLEEPEHLRGAAQRGHDDHPDRIGRYRIVRPLGSGGMGLVYLAEQQSPVRRQVALKVIKQGMDTEQVVARFDTERQALALMNHSNIARVYDAGATEQGRPFFVMEYVKGVPITEHCDRHRLDKRERLGLFVQVCEGLQHAHQKGIIHRDIKASNILVTIQDDRAVPKIIDFGIAKATDRHLTEATVFTELGQIVGTPEYMSPEQADLTRQDIDTRTDIYSLGVLLYVLLVGDYPFDSDSLRNAGFDELRRIIREDDPPRPSTRFTSLGERTGPLSRDRRTDPATFARDLRGDLDWIVMKALDKDRGRRYASAAELAADILRHLDDEPVLARPPSTAYRIDKFVRKHRIGVVSAAVVVLALVSGIIGTTTGMIRARRAEQLAGEAAARANREAEAAQAMSKYLTRVFEQADQGTPEFRKTAKEILESGAEGVYDELADQPELQRRFMAVMGRLYRRMGFLGEARPLLERAVQINLESPDHRNYDMFEAFNLLGTLEMRDRNYERAAELYLEALEIGEEILPPDHEDIAVIHKNLGDVHQGLEQLDEARRYHERALEIRERINSPKLARSLTSLAKVLAREGDLEGAIGLHERSLELRRAQSPGSREVGTGALILAEELLRAGRPSEARPFFEEALGILETTLGNPQHGNIRNACFGLATTLVELGQLESAGPLYERAIAIDEHNYGKEHPFLIETLEAYAEFLGKSERAADASSVQARVDRIGAATRE